MKLYFKRLFIAYGIKTLLFVGFMATLFVCLLYRVPVLALFSGLLLATMRAGSFFWLAPLSLRISIIWHLSGDF